jgi:fatty acid desaturase
MRGLQRDFEIRPLAFVLTYLVSMLGMYALPSLRIWPLYLATLGLGFVTMLVAHEHLHRSFFRSSRLDAAFRLVLSFCALYPITTNVVAHNRVHHAFEDDGALDWADPRWARFRWSLAALVDFPNAIGPVGIEGTRRWLALRGWRRVRAQWRRELAFALGITALLVVRDPWAGLLYVVVPQLFAARSILRLNLLQHDGCDLDSEWNHSRNFVGRMLNWFWCNAGYHTVHHRRPSLHWRDLPAAHAQQVVPRIDPALDEASFLWFLTRDYLVPRWRRERPDEARPGLPQHVRPERGSNATVGVEKVAVGGKAALDEAHAFDEEAALGEKAA